MHLLLLTTPRPRVFFTWIIGLATVVAVVFPFSTTAPLAQKAATAVVNLVLGFAIGTPGQRGSPAGGPAPACGPPRAPRVSPIPRVLGARGDQYRWAFRTAPGYRSPVPGPTAFGRGVRKNTNGRPPRRDPPSRPTRATCRPSGPDNDR